MNDRIHPAMLQAMSWFAPPPRPNFTPVANAFRSGHEACETCSHSVTTVEQGSEAGKWGCTASSECHLGASRGDKPESCPALQALAADTTEETVSTP